jgi:glutamine synthetase
MTKTNARQSAIAAITDWLSNGHHTAGSETPVRQLFGVNVFSDEVMRSRLPEPVYRALRNTIKKGVPLDPSIADVVAAAMREWAMEKGATH